MKKFKFLYFFITITLVSCSSNETENEPDSGNIIADFSFTSEGPIFQFTNLSKNATQYRWDFGDLSFYCDKENPKYIYTRAGGDLEVTLTAMNDMGQEASVIKTITAPEVLDINIEIDNELSDWEDIDVISSGTGNIRLMKIWGGGDSINIYLEGTQDMQLELLSLFINSDNNDGTGFEAWQWGASSGADILYQGPIVGLWWGDIYESNFKDGLGGWSWNWINGITGIQSSDIISIDATTNAFEFSIPKSLIFGDDIPKFMSLALSELNSGWVDVAQIPDSGDDKSFVSYEFPIESSGLCE